MSEIQLKDASFRVTMTDMGEKTPIHVSGELNGRRLPELTINRIEPGFGEVDDSCYLITFSGKYKEKEKMVQLIISESELAVAVGKKRLWKASYGME